MEIASATIVNFRNLRCVETTFASGVNLIYGPNAQGKTNLLEALYMLVTGRSFRTRSERDLVPWLCTDYEATLIRASVRTRYGTDRIVLSFNKVEKHVFVNGEALRRLGELIGRVNAVLFTPADLQLVQGPPQQRRRFLDLCLSQTSRLYLQALQRYDLALRQRNALLKLHRTRPSLREELTPYHWQLAEAGGLIMSMRARALRQLSCTAAAYYAEIAGRDQPLDVRYRPSVGDEEQMTAEAFSDELAKSLEVNVEEDAARGSTSVGPHRDDFCVLLGNHDVRDFGSQGQQRTCVLALKFAELAFVEQECGEAPILFLDDLMSELDEHRRRQLLSALRPDVQVFLTTTEYELVGTAAPVAGVFRMEDGILTRQEP